MYYTYATCALRDRYTRRELFPSRHVASINHSIYRRNSCFETAVPFHLTNVYALCQGLLTLIILINCSSLIKTSQFSVYKSYSNTRMFVQLGFLRRFDPKCEIHRNSIHSDTFHSSRDERNTVFIVTAIVGYEMKSLPFSSIRNRDIYVSPQGPSNNVDSWRIRVPISRHLRQESEPWNLHFFFFIHSRFRIVSSSAHRLLYYAGRVCNTKYITQSTFNLISSHCLLVESKEIPEKLF